MTIGERISEIIIEIETTLLEHAMYKAVPPEFTTEGLRAATYIFMAFMTDKSWELMEEEKMSDQDRENMVVAMGNDIRKMVMTYTGIDTHKLYKNK